MTPTRQATQACAEWLAACIRFGWRKDDLDWLEELWWKYHDSRGNLIETATAVSVSEIGTFRSEAPK